MEKILDVHMTNVEEAAAHGLTVRRDSAEEKNVEEGGAQALAHRNRGKKPKNALSEEIKHQVVEVVQHEIPRQQSLPFCRAAGGT
nr:hypothetical protein [Cohnella laeviribosi]